MTWKKKHLGFQKFDEKYMVSFEFFEKFANHFNFWFVIYIGKMSSVRRVHSCGKPCALGILIADWLTDTFKPGGRMKGFVSSMETPQICRFHCLQLEQLLVWLRNDYTEYLIEYSVTNFKKAVFRARLYVLDLRLRCCKIILIYNLFQPYHTHESTHEWVLYNHACLNFSKLSCINTMTCVRSLKLVVHVVSMSSKFTLIWKIIQRRMISSFLFVWQIWNYFPTAHIKRWREYILSTSIKPSQMLV